MVSDFAILLILVLCVPVSIALTMRHSVRKMLSAPTAEEDPAAAAEIIASVPSTRGDVYKEVLELKYGAQLERLEIVSFSPTTKVLWFDWERNWWGGMNVVDWRA